ncbi:hypothetical protein M2146_002529 [Lachnospiraceae bacterium PF1-22]
MPSSSRQYAIRDMWYPEDAYSFLDEDTYRFLHEDDLDEEDDSEEDDLEENI